MADLAPASGFDHCGCFDHRASGGAASYPNSAGRLVATRCRRVSPERRQRCDAIVLLAPVAEALEDPGGHGRVQQRRAGTDLAHALEEVVAAHLLEDVAGRAGHDAVEHGLVVGERGQHQAADLRVAGADLPGDLDAAALLQLDVEHGHIGPGGRDPVQGLSAGGRLADDLDVALALQQVAHPAPDDLVVVEEEDASGHRAIVAGGSRRDQGPWSRVGRDLGLYAAPRPSPRMSRSIPSQLRGPP